MLILNTKWCLKYCIILTDVNLYFKSSQVRAEHHYTFRLKVSDLLRMQIKNKSGQWVDKVNNYSKYIDMSPTLSLKTPELWARYAYLSDMELAFHKCKVNKTMYIRDVISCDAPNPNTFGTTATIDLNSTTPCLCTFWVAENVDATNIHNFSNYTTDTNDLYAGWDPVKHTTLRYGTVDKIDKMESDHFSVSEVMMHLPSAPCETGYHAMSYANDTGNIHCDIGLTLSNLIAFLHHSYASWNFP